MPIKQVKIEFGLLRVWLLAVLKGVSCKTEVFGKEIHVSLEVGFEFRNSIRDFVIETFYVGMTM